MPGGRIIGFLWFIVLFIAAITSSISMLQPVIAFFEEGFGLKRHASAAMLGLVSALGCGFVLYFSEGMVALDTLDFWVGSVLIIMLALIQAIIYGWCFGIERGAEEAHVGAHMRIPQFVQLMLKYVVPVYLITIFGMFCWNNVPSRDVPLTTLDSAMLSGLNEGGMADSLRTALAAKEIELPPTVSLTRDGNAWEIVNEDDELLYSLGAGDDGVAVEQHKAGYYENIVNNPVALASVMFIGIILGFLLLLVHIAGRRWEAEGRLTYP
jgi:hypothetical protein